MLRGLKKLARFARSLCSYLPVLWRDEDYDYVYLLLLIKHKVKRMREHFEWCSNSPYSKQHRRMRIVELLIDRLNKADYCRYEHDRWRETEPWNDDKIMDIAKQVQHQEEQDWNMVFDIIKRHAQRWWD